MKFDLLAPSSVGKRLKLSKSRVIQLENAGQLPAIRDSLGHRLFRSDVVERFAREREQQAAEVSHV